MHRHYLLPAFSLIAGLCGAFIRASELSRAFEPETGLQIPGESISLIISAFTAAVIIAFAIISVLFKGRLKDGLRVLPGDKSTSAKILVTASALMLIGAAVFDFSVNRGELPLSRIIMIMLAAFAAISILIRAVKPGKEYALFSLVPIFWCCFWLILIYRDRSVDPVVPDYIYELFAVVASALFFYGSAGYDFGSRKIRLNVLYGSAAVYLSTVTAVGPVAAKLLYSVDIVNTDVILYFAACTLYALGGMLWLLDPANRDFAR